MRSALKPLHRATAPTRRCLGEMMRTLTLNNSALLASLLTLTALACNSIVGLDDLSVSDASGGGTDNSPTGGKETTTAGSSANGGTENGTAGTIATSDAGAGGDSPGPVGECTTNQQCTEKASADGAALGASGSGGENAGVVPAVCIKPEGRCEPLLSEDCHTITGDYLNNRAI